MRIQRGGCGGEQRNGRESSDDPTHHRSLRSIRVAEWSARFLLARMAVGERELPHIHVEVSGRESATVRLQLARNFCAGSRAWRSGWVKRELQPHDRLKFAIQTAYHAWYRWRLTRLEHTDSSASSCHTAEELARIVPWLLFGSLSQPVRRDIRGASSTDATFGRKGSV